MEKLREWMKKERWGVGAIGKELGINVQYMSDVLSGRKVPSRELCKKIKTFTNGAIIEADLRPEILGYCCAACGKMIRKERAETANIPVIAVLRDAAEAEVD